MEIKEFMIKIVSEFDDSGFRKLDDMQSDTQKSMKKLSDFLRNFFSFPENAEQVLNGDNTSEYISNKSETNSTVPKTKNSSGKVSAGDVPSGKYEKNFLGNLLPSISLNSFLNKSSSGLKKIITPIAGGLFLNGLFKKSPLVIDKGFSGAPQTFLYGAVNKKNQNDSSDLDKTFTAAHVRYLSEYNRHYNRDYQRNDISNMSTESSRFLSEIASFVNLTSMGNTVLNSGLENYNSDEFNTNDFNNTATTTAIQNSESVSNNSSGTYTLNVAEGAIQINTSGENPQEIGQSVREALAGALDDFILKRGYGGSNE